MLDHYAEDIVLDYPGRNPITGTYRGKEALRQWARKFEELLGPGGSLTRKLHDILASHDHAVQLISVEADRSNGKKARWNVAAVMHIRAGKISEVWLHIDDPYTVDDLFA